MESVERNLGPQSGVTVLSNEGLALDQIIDKVQAKLGPDEAVLFVDFCGGSPYSACRAAREGRPRCALISGVNLPMLFSFFTKREKLPFEQLVETVRADGVRGIQLIFE